MFVTGLSPLLGESFMLLTMIISVPSVLLGVGWLGTLWRGAIRLTTPMLFALGLVFVFGLGGFTGLFLADVLSDVYLHDTFFVVGHFHLTMSAAVLMGAFAATYFWFPKMFGRMMNERLGQAHFVITLVTLVTTFGLQLVLGFGGMQRRLADPSVYEFLRPLMPLNRWVSRSAFIMGAGQILFIVNFFYSLFRGPLASANPWEVGTLDWTVPSPPPHHNFDQIPSVFVGPHEFGNPKVKAALGRDYLAQNEEPPA